MQPNTSSDSTSPEMLITSIKDEFLDLLDKARTLDDLVLSLKLQRGIIDLLLLLFEN